jgi:hypothetical protein
MSGSRRCRCCHWCWRINAAESWWAFARAEVNFKILATARLNKKAGTSLFFGGPIQGVRPRRFTSGSRAGEVSGYLYWPASLCAEEPFRAQPPGPAPIAPSTFEASASREPAAAALPAKR